MSSEFSLAKGISDVIDLGGAVGGGGAAGVGGAAGAGAGEADQATGGLRRRIFLFYGSQATYFEA